LTRVQNDTASRLVAELKAGRLTPESLSQGLAEIAAGGRRQDLLFLQARSTGLTAGLVGMALLEDGELAEGPFDPDDWPYRNVLEAIRDGWRVISFPSKAPLVPDDDLCGLGFEFVLERWR